MHHPRIVALDEVRCVAVAAEQLVEFLTADAGEHGRIGDLVAVQVQDRQHRSVGQRVQKLVRVPARRHRPGLGLAVPDDAGDDQAGIIEGRTIGMRQRIAELAPLVDRPGRLRRHVARDASGKGELGEKPLQARLVLRDVRIDLAVGAFQIGVGDQRRPAVAGTGDEDHVEVARPDQPVQVRVDEVQARRRAPVPEQPRLDVVAGRAAPSGAGCRTDRSGRPTGSSRPASRHPAVPAPRQARQRPKALSFTSWRVRTESSALRATPLAHTRIGPRTLVRPPNSVAGPVGHSGARGRRIDHSKGISIRSKAERKRAHGPARRRRARMSCRPLDPSHRQGVCESIMAPS